MLLGILLIIVTMLICAWILEQGDKRFTVKHNKTYALALLLAFIVYVSAEILVQFVFSVLYYMAGF